ncbi:D-aminoacyl-tRNA deacylase [Roseibacillus ishigakijimensis]|uniref:D-aminoacyl-tRNA deacylase n=1 Tax=Roseibacillus ishigakijimensis TaxID=454146 RepID=A0A934RRA3_9BACT|nr:D-aminoacyl-tRNA deacylase [Roseibacillus ishigakijimensis]MBK1832815.1 D-tyrosyl-tRNA(Tyr) deacylase [Roseibacillus ishigakijimensis]
MRAILQRVSQAEVKSEGRVLAQQGAGLLILLGITEGDDATDRDWLVRKIAAMRIFEDEEGRMNRSVRESAGEVTVVSQFTLYASTKKGNRPSFIKAARPEIAEPLYEDFCAALATALEKPVGRGEFGAMMTVSLCNDGPVTIILDSKNPE